MATTCRHDMEQCYRLGPQMNLNEHLLRLLQSSGFLQNVLIERRMYSLSSVMTGNRDRWLLRPRRVPQCHALCWPSVGDNELSCHSVILPTVCSEEEMGNDDLRGIETEAV